MLFLLTWAFIKAILIIPLVSAPAHVCISLYPFIHFALTHRFPKHIYDYIEFHGAQRSVPSTHSPVWLKSLIFEVFFSFLLLLLLLLFCGGLVISANCFVINAWPAICSLCIYNFQLIFMLLALYTYVHTYERINQFQLHNQNESARNKKKFHFALAKKILIIIFL